MLAGSQACSCSMAGMDSVLLASYCLNTGKGLVNNSKHMALKIALIRRITSILFFVPLFQILNGRRPQKISAQQKLQVYLGKNTTN
jgi:hypothetical protein